MSTTTPDAAYDTHVPVANIPEDLKAAVDETYGYLTLQEVTLRDINGDSHLHLADTVLSPWEVEPYVKRRVAEGSHSYRTKLEPLTEREVAERRERATSLEGDRLVNGQAVSPPWPDYVGLHPEDILSRLHDSTDRVLIEQVRLYEQGGLKRAPILEYTPPAERAPWKGYDDWAVGSILEKLPLLGPSGISDVMAYEAAHRRRPAILTWEPDNTQED